LRIQNRRRRRGGAFTLIELIVVILIIAILAALIVPRIVGRTSDAKIAKAKSDIAELSSQLQAYRADTDKYPTTEQGLQALRTQPSDVQNWHGPYLSKDIPTDPWNNMYNYESPGPNGEDFVIISYGADGAPGGEGDNADLSSNDTK
jgi:general secretion pathway protein G